MKYRIIVAGNRSFDDYSLMKTKLNEYIDHIRLEDPFPDIEIISGAAIGADKLGERYAKEHNISLKVIPAEWFVLGRRAGIVRNGQMADYACEVENPILIAFWNGISKGTGNMIEQAKEHNMEINIVNFVEK